MDETKTCSPADGAAPRLISHGSMGHVALCGCGHLHLTLQYLTLRFEPEAFRELATLLMFAQRRLDSDPHLRAVDPDAPPQPCGPIH